MNGWLDETNEAFLTLDCGQGSLDFFVALEWFGERIRVRILVGPGTECLLGTELLHPHRLEIDYRGRTVELQRSLSW